MHLVYKKGISIILVILMVLSGMNGVFVGGGTAYAAVSFAGGTGTEVDPYQIATAEQLNEVRNHLEEGLYFKLTADIDLSDYLSENGAGYNDGAGWLNIGDYNNSFYGNMDGNGFKITNLMMDRSTDYVGLFGSTSGTISRMILEDVDIHSTSMFAGGLTSFNWGTISNSYVTGTISTSRYVGGLVGNNPGIINNSYFIGSVQGDYEVGGLVGNNSMGTINNSYASGTVVANENLRGGLVGTNSATVNNSYYDKDTTLQMDTGKGDGKSTLEMKTQSTYADWDFDTVWYMVSDQYPQLWAFTGLTKGTNIGTTKLKHVAAGMEFKINDGVYTDITDNSLDNIDVAVGDIITVRIKEAPLSSIHLTVSLKNIRGLNPPALTADTTDNYTAYELEITFGDIPAWRAAISAVTDGLTTLVEGDQYTIDEGKITIVPGALTEGIHHLTITATGYDDGLVDQTVRLFPSPELIADTTENYTVNDIEITFTDDSDWRDAITTVAVGTTILVEETQYTINEGTLTIPATVLEKGTHTITVTAPYYNDAVVDQFVDHLFTGAGAGSLIDPYQIASDDQLNEVRYHMEAGLYFELVGDIDLSDYATDAGWIR